MGYAKLLLRVYPRRANGLDRFDGQLLKPGAVIEHSALWPTTEYPPVPLLLEYAGSDHSGRGHNRAKSIYILWRYELVRTEWVEVARAVSDNDDWHTHLVPIAFAEINRGTPPRDAKYAAAVCGRILGALDSELDRLTIDDRDMVMHFVYEQFTARAITYATQNMPLFQPAVLGQPGYAM
jgi:hypothetical protein